MNTNLQAIRTIRHAKYPSFDQTLYLTGITESFVLTASLSKAARSRRHYILNSNRERHDIADTSRGSHFPPARRAFSSSRISKSAKCNSKASEIIKAFEAVDSIDFLSQSDSWGHILNVNNLWREQSASSRNEQAQRVKLVGYVTSQRFTKKACFVQLADEHLSHAIQLVIPLGEGSPISLSDITRLTPHTPVMITGKVVERLTSRQDSETDSLDPYVGEISYLNNIEIQIASINPLNTLPADLSIKHGTNYGPEQRNLEFRSNHNLRKRVVLRAHLTKNLTVLLSSMGFNTVETPLLFKSTPEGAREFLVPTRQKGMAYALPQSPQQYKQILMASGFSKYFQFARCFRDEDSRADRQPEFTQLDIEMGFATSGSVMAIVEKLLSTIWNTAKRQSRLPGERVPGDITDKSGQLPRLTYQEAMLSYGSDKPDPRWGAEIKNIDSCIPEQCRLMMSSLDNPVTEMFKLQLNTDEPRVVRGFIADFMQLPSSAQFSTNPDGMPAFAVYDLQAPLRGLSSFGHEGPQALEELFEPEPGNILIAQTRQRKSLSGGSTALGQIRQRIHEYAVKRGLVTAPEKDSLLWVVDFPLFSPLETDSPGQGGAEICSTHHPFTAPKPRQDLSKLFTSPLEVVGDHYDLVVNGVEVGGGSRRIHRADMQELIFRDVLKMKPERIEDFRHLLNALKYGCPPHAGFAFGFDRLVSLLADADSVRDVIPFPKYNDGKDPFVGSPSRITSEQLKTYHLNLAVNDVLDKDGDEKISHKA